MGDELPTLVNFPHELLHRLFSSLTLRSAARIAAVSSNLWDAFLSMPKNDVLFRRTLLARLGLSAHVATRSGEDDKNLAWRDELREIQNSFAKLRALGTIEGQQQKYLRWCNETAFDSARVRHAIVGLSLLPANIDNLFDEGSGRMTEEYRQTFRFLFEGMPQAWLQERLKNSVMKERAAGTEAVELMELERLLLNSSERQEEGAKGLVCLQHSRTLQMPADQSEAATRHFDVKHFQALLRWLVVAPEQEESEAKDLPPEHMKIRLLMAEFDQMQWRDVPTFLQSITLSEIRDALSGALSPSRLVQSFIQLHKLSQRNPLQDLYYWA